MTLSLRDPLITTLGPSRSQTIALKVTGSADQALDGGLGILVGQLIGSDLTYFLTVEVKY